MKEIIFKKMESFNNCGKKRTYCIANIGDICCKKIQLFLDKRNGEDNFFLYSHELNNKFFETSNYEHAKKALIDITKVIFENYVKLKNIQHLKTCKVEINISDYVEP